jgi:hypothetical protein
MNDIDARIAKNREGEDFEEDERVTQPGTAPRTKTSRWRAVASSALQRGLGRLSDGDFDQGNEPEAPAPSCVRAETAVDVEVEVEVGDGAMETADSGAPTEQERQDDTPPESAPVPRWLEPGRPTRDFGPHGTTRIVIREDLGPTGTMKIRRRRSPGTGGRRAGVKLLGFVAACAVVVVIGYRGDRSTGREAAAATLAPPSSAAVLPVAAPALVEPAATPSSVVEASTAAATGDPPRRAAPGRKGSHGKSNVF